TSAVPSGRGPTLQSVCAPSARIAEAGLLSVRQDVGSVVKVAFPALKVIVTFGIVALPGAAASSLRLKYQVEPTGAPIWTGEATSGAQAPSSSYTVAACAAGTVSIGMSNAAVSAVAPARRRCVSRVERKF